MNWITWTYKKAYNALLVTTEYSWIVIKSFWYGFMSGFHITVLIFVKYFSNMDDMINFNAGMDDYNDDDWAKEIARVISWLFVSATIFMLFTGFKTILVIESENNLLLYLRSELGPLSGVPTEDLVRTFKEFCELQPRFRLPLEYGVLDDEGIIEYILKLLNQIYYEDPSFFSELMFNQIHVKNKVHNIQAMDTSFFVWWDWKYNTSFNDINYLFEKWFNLEGVNVEVYILKIQNNPLNDNLIGRAVLWFIYVYAWDFLYFWTTHGIFRAMEDLNKLLELFLQTFFNTTLLSELKDFPTIKHFELINSLKTISILDYFQNFFLKHDPDFCHLSLDERLNMKIKDLNMTQLLRLKILHYHYCLDYFSVKSNIIKDLTTVNSMNESVKNIQIDIDEVQEELTKLKINNNSKNRFFEDIENKF